MPNWSFRSVGTAATGANPSPGLPSGWQQGDLLIIHAAGGASSSFSGTVTGYTNLELFNSSGLPALGVWAKIAGASESAPSLSNSNTACNAQMLAYQNISSATQDAKSTVASGGAGSVTAASVTTTANDDCVIHFYVTVAGTSQTWTGPGAPTSTRINTGGVSATCGIFVCDEDQATAGATTARTASVNRSVGIAGCTVAFKQTPPAGGITPPPDFTNPTPLPQNLELRKWIQSPIPSPNPVPNYQNDWPNPRGQPRSTDLLTWTQWSIFIPPAPFRQTEWPNPVLAKPNVDLRGWIQSPLPSPQSIPFLQRDFPNPTLPKPNYDLRGWIEAPQPSPNPIPPSQTDWPNPQVPKRSIDALRWSWSFPPTPPPAVPFGPYDWPNPTIAPQSSFDELRTWINGVVGPVSPTFSQYDWPNPRTVARSIDALTWTWTIPPTAILPPSNAQRDWPNPIIRTPNLDLRGWIQAPQPNPNPIPPAQHDWPLPLVPLRIQFIYQWNSIPIPSLPQPVTGIHEIGLGFNLLRLGGRLGSN